MAIVYVATPDVKYESGKRKEIAKYLGELERGNKIYFVPGTLAEWLGDIDIPIVITEGEKKALALWRLGWFDLSDASEQARFMLIALTGVWSWRGVVGKEINAVG